MIDVQQVTFIPTESGGEVQADMQVGQQKIASAWRLESSTGMLKSLLDRLIVQVEQIAFVPSPDGGEIRVSMRLGDRAFVSTLPVENEDGDLKPSLDDLRDEVGREFARTIRRALDDVTVSETVPEQATSLSTSRDMPQTGGWAYTAPEWNQGF